MSSLKIVATLISTAAHDEELDAAVRALADESRKEPGCLSYVICKTAANPRKTVILEEWKDQAAIDAHNQAPHFTAFGSAIEGRIESLHIMVLETVY